jgi:hypothetical protein
MSYVIKPTASYEWGSVTVYEPDQTPRDTGILDAHGNKIFHVVDRNPIGFLA